MVRNSLPRAVALRVGDANRPNVSLSAHAHSAGWPAYPGTQAAWPPRTPGLVMDAPGSSPVKLEMNELAEPDKLPPINKMNNGPDFAAGPVLISYTASTTRLASPLPFFTMAALSDWAPMLWASCGCRTYPSSFVGVETVCAGPLLHSRLRARKPPIATMRMTTALVTSSTGRQRRRF